ncbi:MAG: thioesterase family protein [Desulfatibacillaceae bacterium]|nr:thioesterase family protein [Desulfatibacillaceae bacterium]
MHPFDRDTALTPAGPGRYELAVSDEWSINRTANGGYIMAIMALAMGKETDKQATPIITVNYTGRCEPKPALITVEKIAQSGRFDRFCASLSQDGKERARAFGTFAQAPEKESLRLYEAAPPQVAAFESCIQMPKMDNYSLYGHMDVRLDPECSGWFAGSLAERSIQKGWGAFRQERELDLPAVLLVADSLPPAVMVSQGILTWVPTIEMSVNVRNLPKSGRLKCIFESRFVDGGMVEEDGQVWDGDTLVAISRQIALFRK